MDKYDVVGILGEGSFGRVYKAKRICDGEFVALKVISKRGRSMKELKGLRGECEIQRHLHHPNIIQMLDSFETENEIVVITEFAHKELNKILGKEGYLPEDRVQKIVWDLLSALYYLHSHRVLHRDLKPQNILLDVHGVAKLCDFGFARNMSTGTHVLTSIKGTPLYMAPELIEEHPYDHNADLWSLGCIIYELFVGAPPFCTASILHLIRLIKHEQVQWPTFISDHGISFLKGLLQKNPSDRFTWSEIINHPFVKGHILVTEDTLSMPLTRPLSANTLQLKQQQRIELSILKGITQMKVGHSKSPEKKCNSTNKSSSNACKSNNTNSSDQHQNKTNNGDSSNELRIKSVPETEEKRQSMKTNANLQPSLTKDELSTKKDIDDLCHSLSNTHLEINVSTNINLQKDVQTSDIVEEPKQMLDIIEDCKPMENEEWVVFLQKIIVDVMNEDVTELVEANMANVIVSPLRNRNSSSKIINLVANVFSLPFVIKGIPKNTLEDIEKVYLEVKLIPNLVYSSKLLLKPQTLNSSQDSATGGTPVGNNSENWKSVQMLTGEDLQALEDIYCLICYLTHSDNKFLYQFCDSIAVLNISVLIYRLLGLSKKKPRIVNDLLAILINVLRKTPENNELIQRIFKYHSDCPDEALNFVGMLKDSNALLRERVCRFLAFLAKNEKKTLENLWNDEIKETVEDLVYDSMEAVRNAADMCVEHVKSLNFVNRSESGNGEY